jgi:hypothetical protein
MSSGSVVGKYRHRGGGSATKEISRKQAVENDYWQKVDELVNALDEKNLEKEGNVH